MTNEDVISNYLERRQELTDKLIEMVEDDRDQAILAAINMAIKVIDDQIAAVRALPVIPRSVEIPDFDGLKDSIDDLGNRVGHLSNSIVQLDQQIVTQVKIAAAYRHGTVATEVKPKRRSFLRFLGDLLATLLITGLIGFGLLLAAGLVK